MLNIFRFNISNNLKSFISDSISYTILNIVDKSIPFILLPIIIRMVTPEDYGLYSIFLTVETLLMPIVTLYIHSAISKHYYLDGIILKEYIPTIIFSLSFFVIIFLVLSLLVPESITSILGFNLSYLRFAIVTSYVMGIVVFVSTIFRLQRKPWNYGKYYIGQDVLLFSSIILFTYYLPSFKMLIMGKLLYAGIIILVTLIILYKINLLSLKFNRVWFYQALKFSLPNVLYSITAFIFFSSDRFLIKYFLGTKEVGYYSAIIQLAGLMSILGFSMNAAWLPWLFENLKKNDTKTNLFIVKLSYLLIIVFLLIGFIFCIIFPFIAKIILTDDFNMYLSISYPLIMGFAFQAIYLIVSPYIFYVEKTKFNALIGFIVAATNVSLNVFLIPKLGLVGAAYTNFISWFLLASLFFLFSYKIYPMPWFTFLKIKK